MNKEKYPDKIYATERVGSNGINCLDYRNEDDDVEYIKSGKNDKCYERGDRCNDCPSDYPNKQCCQYKTGEQNEKNKNKNTKTIME